MSVEKITQQIQRGCDIITDARVAELPGAVEAIPASSLVDAIATAHNLMGHTQVTLERATNLAEASFPGGSRNGHDCTLTGLRLVLGAVQGAHVEDAAHIAGDALENSIGMVDTQLHEARILARRMAKHVAALARLNQEFEQIMNPSLHEHAQTAAAAADVLIITAQEYAKQISTE